MNNAYFSAMSARACGYMASAFIIALIIGFLSVVGRKKKLGAEAYKIRKGSVTMWTYCIILALETLTPHTVLTNRGYTQQIDFSILPIEIVFSLIIYGIYKFIVSKVHATSDKESGDNDKDNEKKSTDHLISSDAYWTFSEYVYSKVKKTSIFKTWKKEQFDSQFGKCAICGKPMVELRYGRVVHIKPKKIQGTNYANNLALVHDKCSKTKEAEVGFKYPKWVVKDNQYSSKLNDKVYEITEEIRVDYPVKFPDEHFKKPKTKK